MAAESSQTPWPSRSLEYDGQRRYYLDSVTGEVPVVMLHGIPSHHVIWREVAGGLHPEIRAIAPDLTGFGLSDSPEYADLSPGGQARDMLNFLDALDVNQFGVVAHDYGVLVACAILEEAGNRVTYLAVTNTSLQAQDWSGARFNPFRLVRLPLVGELAFKLARPFMLKRAYSTYVVERHKLDGPLMDELWKPFENGFDRTLLRLSRQEWAGEEEFARWRALLSEFERPGLVTWGALDPTFGVDRAIDIATTLPQAAFVVLRHSNHFVPIDVPQTLAQLVNQLVVGSDSGGESWQAPS